MSAREIISLLFRERLAVAIAFIVPLLLALAAYAAAPVRYEATAKLLLGSGPEFQDNSAVGRPPVNAPISTTQEVLNSELEILNSRDIARDTIEDMGIGNVFPELGESGRAFDSSLAAAVEQFESALTVRPIKSSNILEIAFASPDPQRAATILEHLITHYQQKHIEAHARPLSSFLDTQVADFAHNLRTIEGEIAELKSAKRIVSIDDERKQLLDDRNSTQQTITQLKARTAELASRIVQLQGLLKRTPEKVQLYTESEQSDSLERAKSQLLDLELQEKQLTSKYGDENRQVVAIRSQMAVLRTYILGKDGQFNGRVRDGRNPLFDEITAEIARAQAEVQPDEVRAAALADQIARADERLKVLDGAQRILVGLERERTSLETSVKTYGQRQADAHIQEELDRQKIISVSVIQAPQSDFRPAQPKLLRYLGLGIGGGIAATIALVGLIFAFRNTYITPESVETATNVPVLVSLPVR